MKGWEVRDWSTFTSHFQIMKDIVLASSINGSLRRRYGINFKNEPVFRVVWSDDQFEDRLGTYEDYYNDTIFLRTVTCVRRVPKYSYVKARWILERWIAGELMEGYHDEVPGSTGGSYEPIYVYQDANENALPLCEEVTYALISSLFTTVGKSERESIDASEKDKKEKGIREADLDVMEEASPYLAGKLHDGEAVFIGDKRYVGNSKDTSKS